MGYTPASQSGGGQTKPAVSRTPTYMAEYVQPDITTTQYITNQIYQSLIGRNATQQEVNEYHQMFLDYAKTHPIYTRTTQYTVDPATGMQVASRDITAGKAPLSETDFINNIVQGTADAKEYRAATGYLNEMMKVNDRFRGAYSG